jgi:hypothetical protein
VHANWIKQAPWKGRCAPSSWRLCVPVGSRLIMTNTSWEVHPQVEEELEAAAGKSEGEVPLWRQYINPTFVQAFTMTALAEWGDRSQVRRPPELHHVSPRCQVAPRRAAPRHTSGRLSLFVLLLGDLWRPRNNEGRAAAGRGGVGPRLQPSRWPRTTTRMASQ